MSLWVWVLIGVICADVAFVLLMYGKRPKP